MFSGVHTAIITPLRDGSIDYDALTALIERQIDGGVSGIVPCGTTGESATMRDEEIVDVIRHTVEVAAGRCLITAGVGTNNTARTIDLAKRAVQVGADAGLVITPYYNKPGQEGLYQHCATVAAAVPELPIMLYNVPGRTGVSFSVDTVVRLAELENVRALKEASADMAFASEIIAQAGESLEVLSGDDVTALPLWSVGGRGVVSVTSNLLPERMANFWRTFAHGDLEAARRMHLELVPLFNGLFLETNPVPVKALVAAQSGLCGEEVRLPLTPLSDRVRARLEAICAALDIRLTQ